MKVNEPIEKFLKNNDCKTIGLVRGDGVLIEGCEFSSGNHHIGALVGGIYQASSELAKSLGQSDDSIISYGNSKEGFYISQLIINQQNYYLYTSYHELLNPAKLKWNFKKLINEVSSYYSKGDDVNHDYLFRDISDEEINKMFAQAGV